MNTVMLNTVHLDGAPIIKKGSGGGGGATINNQSKSVDITENGSVSVTPDAGYTGLSKVDVNVNVPSSGGGSVVSVPRNAVNFLDYDGTILHSYTKEEFLALSAMPELPTREGLICQEWNWEFADAQSYVGEYGVLDVGATYITDDGKTRLYISIATEGRMTVPLCFRLEYNEYSENEVKIDWGDGSPIESIYDYGVILLSHKYANIGEYVITLDVVNGTARLGGNSNGKNVMGNTYDNNHYVYSSMLKKVEIGRNMTLSSYAFQRCESLEYIVIPNSVTSITQNAFYYCYSFKFIVIPNSITSIEGSAFTECYSLAFIAISNSVINIGYYAFDDCEGLKLLIIPNNTVTINSDAFRDCKTLTSVIVPNSITEINSSLFYNCCGAAYFDFSFHKAVPTLASSVFAGLPSDCKIIVPDTLYDEWIAATNWSTYASYIIKKSDWDASQA